MIYNQGKAEGKADGLLEGEAKGKTEGLLEGQLVVLEHLYRQGILSEAQIQSMTAPLRQKLNDLMR